MKRLLSMVVAITMAGTLLAGCGSKGDTDKASQDSQKQVSKKPQKVRVLVPFHPDSAKFPAGKDLNTNDIVTIFKEKSGIDVEFDMLPKDGSKEKFSVLAAFGDFADLAYVPGGKSDVAKFAAQDVFQPVDDLLKKMPDYNKLVAADLHETVKLNGKAYAFLAPAAYQFDRSVVIRKDLFDNHGIKIPKTLEEYYNAFKEIKTKAGMIPYGMDTSDAVQFFAEIAPFAGAYGVEYNTTIKNGKLVMSHAQPEYKEVLAYLKKLYDEGLLDKEFAVNKKYATRDKMVGGQTAMGNLLWNWAKDAADAIKKKGANYTLKFIEPPVGKDGKQGVRIASPVQFFYVVPKNAKATEASAQFMNFMYTEHYQNAITYGKEGVSYTKENGKVKHDNDKFLAEFPWIAVYNTVNVPDSFAYRLELKGFTPFVNDMKSVWKYQKDLTEYAPPIEAYDSVKTQLDNFVHEHSVKFIMGARSLNEFDKFVEEFNAKGGKAAAEALDQWYQKSGKNIK